MRRILVASLLAALGGCCGIPVTAMNPCSVARPSCPPSTVALGPARPTYGWDAYIDSDGSRKLYERFPGGVHQERLPAPASP